MCYTKQSPPLLQIKPLKEGSSIIIEAFLRLQGRVSALCSHRLVRSFLACHLPQKTLYSRTGTIELAVSP